MRLPTKALSLIGVGAIMAGLCVSGVGAAAIAVDPITQTVPTPYDDLSSIVCPDNSVAYSPISTAAGRSATVMWALAGDTIEYIGSAKGCQLITDPSDVPEFGFYATELQWRLRLPGQPLAQAQIITSGVETLQEGRAVIPTRQRLIRVATAEDEGASLYYNTIGQIETPNGAGAAGSTNSLRMHVLDPKLSLTKEVCVFGTAAECAATNDAAWVPSTQVARGANVFWRLTATNDGNIALNNIKVSGDTLANGTADSNSCVGTDVVASLNPGEKASIVCQTPGLQSSDTATNTAKLTSTFVDPSPTLAFAPRFPNGVESNEASAEVKVLNPAISLVKEVCVAGSTCDPTVATDWTASSTLPLGSAAVWRLTASNTGNTVLTNVKPSLEELSGAMSGTSAECTALDFGTLAAGESRSLTCETAGITDTTQATVNTAKVEGVPANDAGVAFPEFTNPIESDEASAEVSVLDPAVRLVKEVCVAASTCDPTVAADWTASSTIPIGSAAVWRLTVSNTGNTALTNVKPSLEELSGAMSGASAECAALDFGTLKVGESRSLTCETAGITDTTQSTVNTAKVEGVPADDAGVALPAFTKHIESNEASAEVMVLAPAVTLVKEVCVAASKCDPTVAADWTASSTIPIGSAAVWRLTVSNTGNTALTNVKPNLEELSGAMSGKSDACAALDFGTLKVGESRSLTCETAGITDTTQATVNTAKVEGVPADDAGVALPAFTKPVESNEASAEVSVLAPAVALVKEVCVSGSKCDPTVAADWTASSTIPIGSAAVWRLTASNTGNTALTNVKPNLEELSGAMSGTSAECAALDFGTLAAGESRSLTCETAGITDTTQATVNTAKIEGVPADNAGVALPAFTKPVESNEESAEVSVLAPAVTLVKEVCVSGSKCDPTVAADWTASSTIPLGSAAVWRLTVSNTGNTALTNVKPNLEELSGAMSGASAECAALDFGTLKVGESRSLTCETAGITDITQTTVNTAKIAGVPADDAGVALPAFTKPIESNEASAEVSVLAPAVTLVKEVCVAESKCDPTVAADWTASSTIPVGSAAVWRLTASNTGNTALTNVKPSLEQLSGAMSGKSDACAALDFGTLKVGESRSLTCETAGITDASQAAVNTAKVEGVPADDAGVALPAFTKPLESNEASAEVLVLAPSVKLVKEVCVKGSKCDPTVAADWKASSTVTTGAAAVWRLTASNTGNTTLANVKPSFEELSGAMSGASAACTALDFGTLAAGESRSLTCETAGITNTTKATVNTAAVSGVPADSTGAPLPQFKGAVQSAKATASVTVASSSEKKVNPNKKPNPSQKTNPNTPVNKATSPETEAKGLATTGGETSFALIAAASLLLVGGAGVLFARRRRA